MKVLYLAITCDIHRFFFSMISYTVNIEYTQLKLFNNLYVQNKKKEKERERNRKELKSIEWGSFK